MERHTTHIYIYLIFLVGTNPLVQGLGSLIHYVIYRVQSRRVFCSKITILNASLRCQFRMVFFIAIASLKNGSKSLSGNMLFIVSHPVLVESVNPGRSYQNTQLFTLCELEYKKQQYSKSNENSLVYNRYIAPAVQ